MPIPQKIKRFFKPNKAKISVTVALIVLLVALELSFGHYLKFLNAEYPAEAGQPVPVLLTTPVYGLEFAGAFFSAGTYLALIPFCSQAAGVDSNARYCGNVLPAPLTWTLAYIFELLYLYGLSCLVVYLAARMAENEPQTI